MAAKRVKGFVYLIHCPGLSLWKIGVSASPTARVNGLKGSMGHKCELLHSIPSNNAMRLERELHDAYASQRTEGEWFRLDEAAVAAICAITSRDYERTELISDAVLSRVAVNLPAAWMAIVKRLARENKHPIVFCLVDLIQKEAQARGMTDLPAPPWDDSQSV